MTARNIFSSFFSAFSACAHVGAHPRVRGREDAYESTHQLARIKAPVASYTIAY